MGVVSIKNWELIESSTDQYQTLTVSGIISIHSEVSLAECKGFLRVVARKFIRQYLKESGVLPNHPNYSRERNLVINYVRFEFDQWQRRLQPIIKAYRDVSTKPEHYVVVKSDLGIYTFASNLKYRDIT